MRRLIFAGVMLLVALVALLVTLIAYRLSEMVLSALWSGALHRSDIMGDFSDVTIFRTTDPERFWMNVQFYGFISALFWLVALLFDVPITICLIIYLKRMIIYLKGMVSSTQPYR